ncbi:MAG TPA: DUF4097 family beta strand repeat-containing protein [Pyrinomonadaceae bacterium]|nr:DUF4097 family beta strand repeat-containing protein [Pyrinomonadaceae bacterium]
MRRNSSYYLLPVAVCLLACLSIRGAVAAAPLEGGAGVKDDGSGTRVITAEQSLPAEATVTVLMCIESGDVLVRGWDRREVRARSVNAPRIELRRADATADPNPATRVEVLVARDANEPARPGLCSNSNLELDVPHGSTVQIKGNTGDISITGVANARAGTLSGDIELQGITKSTEASSINGTLVMRKSKGRMRLETIGGEIVAGDLSADEAADEFSVKSVSGEITLTNIGHTHVEAFSSNSPINFTGALAGGGLYTLKSHSGSIRLSLPSDSSFQLNAKVHHSGEIVTDFPIRQVPLKATGTGHNPHGVGGPLLSEGRLTGVTGKGDKGDATLILSSFSGTVHLQRQQ